MLQCKWSYIILRNDKMWCATRLNPRPFVFSYIPYCIDDVDMTMFADDTNFMKAINSFKETKEELIPAVRKVCNWR